LTAEWQASGLCPRLVSGDREVAATLVKLTGPLAVTDHLLDLAHDLYPTS
jgi:hypothetical protein